MSDASSENLSSKEDESTIHAPLRGARSGFPTILSNSPQRAFASPGPTIENGAPISAGMVSESSRRRGPSRTASGRWRLSVSRDDSRSLDGFSSFGEDRDGPGSRVESRLYSGASEGTTPGRSFFDVLPSEQRRLATQTVSRSQVPGDPHRDPISTASPYQPRGESHGPSVSASSPTQFQSATQGEATRTDSSGQLQRDPQDKSTPTVLLEPSRREVRAAVAAVRSSVQLQNNSREELTSTVPPYQLRSEPLGEPTRTVSPGQLPSDPQENASPAVLPDQLQREPVGGSADVGLPGQVQSELAGKFAVTESCVQLQGELKGSPSPTPPALPEHLPSKPQGGFIASGAPDPLPSELRGGSAAIGTRSPGQLRSKELEYATPTAVALPNQQQIQPRGDFTDTVSPGSSSAVTGDTMVLKAIQSGELEAVETALKNVDETLAARDLGDATLVMRAAETGCDQIFSVILDAMLEKMSAQQVSGILSSAFHCGAVEARGCRDDKALVGLSVLLQHSAKPKRADLILLARTVQMVKLDDCFFRGISSARNSFVPGLILSFALDDASDHALEMERKVLVHLLEEVDTLLSEVLRWLPRTVAGLAGGMEACACVMEPEMSDTRVAIGVGPLAVAVHCPQRIVTFATTPLGMDYMLQKFTRGLPGLNNGARVIVLEIPRYDPREEGKWRESLTPLCDGSWLGIILTVVGDALTGESLCGLTLFPGIYFITTGIVSVPNSYYKVPVVRMALAVIVYAGMLALFTKEVVLHDDGRVGTSEIVFAVYVAASLVNEAMEVWRDSTEYALDRWNSLDLLALLVTAAAFIVRVVDYDSVWGRSLYAAATPLMYWRLLFFAQVLQYQGAMIQVIFSMASELLQFTVVMGVVMLGFAVAFLALFQELENTTINDSLLSVFKAMLGELGFFDDFSGTRFDSAATFLLVWYLIIMSIMLLNLLIAVLSTAHSKLEENILIRVSKARLYTYFQRVVRSDVLPSPFNVVQLATMLPCRILDFFLGTRTHRVARRFVGRVIFWLVMSPFAIVGGSLLWLHSVPKAVLSVWRAPMAGSGSMCSKATRSVLCVLWCVVGVPLSLASSALLQAPNVFLGRTGILEASSPPHSRETTVESMLREATGGMGMKELRKYLKDPAVGGAPYLQVNRRVRPTTVEHVQHLRERLEAFTVKRIDELNVSLRAGMEAVAKRGDARMNELEEKLDLLLARFPDAKSV